MLALLLLSLIACAYTQDPTTTEPTTSGSGFGDDDDHETTSSICPVVIVADFADTSLGCNDDDSKCAATEKCCRHGVGYGCHPAVKFVVDVATAALPQHDLNDLSIATSVDVLRTTLQSWVEEIPIPTTVATQIASQVETELQGLRTAYSQVVTLLTSKPELVAAVKEFASDIVTESQEKEGELATDAAEDVAEFEAQVRSREEDHASATESRDRETVLKHFYKLRESQLGQKVEEGKLLKKLLKAKVAAGTAACIKAVVDLGTTLPLPAEINQDATAVLTTCLKDRLEAGYRLAVVRYVIESLKDQREGEKEHLEKLLEEAASDDDEPKSWDKHKQELEDKKEDFLAALNNMTASVTGLKSHGDVDLEITENEAKVHFRDLVVDSTGKTREEKFKELLPELKVLLVAAGADVRDDEDFEDADSTENTPTGTTPTDTTQGTTKKRQTTQTFTVSATVASSTDTTTSSGLSGGAIAGIVIGCVVGTLLVLVLVYLLVQKKSDFEKA